MFGRELTITFDGADIKPINNLRVQFQVEKADGETFNRASISVYNLNPTSRAALAVARPVATQLVEPRIVVRLFAGYEGNVPLLIAGDLYIANSRRVGSDWITNIEILSGIYAATKSQSTISLEGKINGLFIAQQILEPLGLSVDYTPEAESRLTNDYREDFSESGLSLRTITTFLSFFDLAFTIEEDSKGLVYERNAPRDDRGRSEDNAFHKNNGLIGSPVVTTTGVSILALLRPGLQIMQPFFVESQTIRETLQQDTSPSNKFVVKSIRHFGDTHDDEWFTVIEGFYAELLEGSYAG